MVGKNEKRAHLPEITAPSIAICRSSFRTTLQDERHRLARSTRAFITDFELFLPREKNHCTNTGLVVHDAGFAASFIASINNGWLPRDPFYAYHITKRETKRGFLYK